MLFLVAGPSTDGDAAPVTPPVASPQPGPPTPTATPIAAAEPVLLESCDGARTATSADPGTLTCSRWTIAWREGGTPWGFVVADSYDAVIAERERQLGFARQYARFFEVPIDERYTDPGQPICSTCESEAPQGRWGEGQVFGDGPARRAIAGAEAELRALDAALDEHVPKLKEVARLAQDAQVGKVAREHAKQMRLGMLELSKGRLALDNAAVFRSEDKAQQVGRSAGERVKALAKSSDALEAAVGRAVAKAHGGSYLEEGAASEAKPRLEVDFDGAKVVAIYKLGDAQATWFEGKVSLDGGIAGRSLLAPEDGKLKCQAHTEECGYVYIDSMLRFTQREAKDDKPAQEVAELWFRRSTWVMAKPFVR